MMKKLFSITLIFFSLLLAVAFKDAAVQQADDWTDFNKNGKKDVYEDKDQPTEKRVADLLKQMNTNEKTCQLTTLYGYGAFLKDRQPTVSWKDSV